MLIISLKQVNGLVTIQLIHSLKDSSQFFGMYLYSNEVL